MGVADRVITIVGCGPGSPDYITPAALKAIEGAGLLVGAKRLLELFPSVTAERVAVSAVPEDAVEAIAGRTDLNPVAALVTGDPGLFSLAGLVIRRFGRENCRVIPGISSIQVAFARLGLDWHDARIISAHKQDPDPAQSMIDADKIAVLGGREGSIRWVADHLLCDRAEDRRIFVCENLTLEDERVSEVRSADLRQLQVSPRTVIIIVKRRLLS
jgi:precorrin-6y C5,15-methyltransferase (decarboxylating) CbiE subunit